MIKYLFLFIFITHQVLAYSFSYVPKTQDPKLYKILSSKKEKCTEGNKESSPTSKSGVCISCPENYIYLIDDIKKQAYCYRCPTGTLLTKKDGYPMCLSNYPVQEGSIIAENKEDEAEKIKETLNASYKTPKIIYEVKKVSDFRNIAPLENVCSLNFPDDPEAQNEVEKCKRIASQNDFLCPYVEKNYKDTWHCKACPKNAPYKNKQGECFTCPYGEETIVTSNGESICASLAPKPERKVPQRKSQKKRLFR
ncbi:MAG: hypothetical protein MJ250_06705 [Alphaproteobacteria bacterium]|nr:hypothetical protein [Alphaproteobacteria bacterium]